MKIYHGTELIGELITDKTNLTVFEAIEAIGVDMDEFAAEHGWDDWDPEELRTELE